VPIGLTVEGANRNDFKMVHATIESMPVARPEPTLEQPQGMCWDKGYDDDEVRELLTDFGFTAHIRARGEEAKALKQEAGYKARRWVVEMIQS
jgi:putative transposase